MSLHLVLGQVGETEPGQNRVHPQRDGVEHQLAVDPDPQRASALLELPGVDPAIGRQSHIDAAMGHEVLRPRGLGVSCEIAGCADHRHAKIRPDAHRDHVLCHLFAEANAGVVTLRDDVGETVVDVHLHLDVGISRQQFCQRRPEDRDGRMFGRGDAEGAGRLVSQLGQRG